MNGVDQRKALLSLKANGFRFLFSLLALSLMVLVVKNADYLVNTGTDENRFRASKSGLYIHRNIRALRGTREARRYLNLGEREIQGPRKGDLLTQIEGQWVTTASEAEAALNRVAGRNTIRITIQRPTRDNYMLKFEMDADSLSGSFFWEIPPTVHVFYVPPGGASDRAGMKEGDLIHQINGKTFTSGEEADQLVKSTLRGQTVDYGIIRAGEFLILKVTMARLTIPFALIVYLLVGALFLATGAFLALVRPNLREARLLGLGIFLLGVSFVLFENRSDAQSQLFPVAFRQLSLALLYLGLAFLLHASYYFPRERPKLLAMGWPRYSSYPIAGAASLWAWLAGSVALAPGVALLITPHFALRFWFRKAKTREQRNFERYILAATFFLLVTVVIWYGLEERLNYNAGLLLRAIPALLFLLAYLYTINRFRLLGIQVRRGIQYTLTSLLWGVFLTGLFIYGLSFLASSSWRLVNIRLTPRNIEFLQRPVDPRKRAQNEKILAMLLALAMGFGFLKLGRFGLHLLRRKFHRTTYDYHKTSKELTELLSARLKIEDLAGGIITKLAQLMMLKRVGIVIFRDGREVCCSDARGFSADVLARFCAQQGRQLAETLRSFRSELRVEYLDVELKEPLLREELKYLAPIRSEDQLIGCLLAGEKLAEVTFKQRDFAFLSATARQAAVAIENAFLYERLASQERIRHELSLARQIQLSSLPQTQPQILGLDIAGASRPAFEVGGDYYAYFYENSEDLLLIVGDVSGKGTSAALYMSKIQGIFSTLFQPELGPKAHFLKANPILYREMDRRSFVTAIGARFQTRKRILSLARAGHIPLLAYRARTREVRVYQPKGLGLGIENRGVFHAVLEEIQIGYETDDVFLFMTDGLSETFNAEQEPFGEQRTLEILAEHAHLSALEIRDAVLSKNAAFAAGTVQQDDLTLVVVKVGANGSPEAPVGISSNESVGRCP